MSDEEDGEMEDGTKVKMVMLLIWRNPLLRILFEQVDLAPTLEERLWRQAGKTKIKRIRVEDQPAITRPIPTNLPRSFFTPGLLEAMQDYQLEALVLSSDTLPMLSFDIGN